MSATTPQPDADAEVNALRCELRSAGEESDLLLLQVTQLHEELEDRAERCRALERRLDAAVSASGLVALSIGEIRTGSERNVPPYRELTFDLQDVQVGQRNVPAATVRLVEHNGYPGFVIFADAQGNHLTQSWQELGQEYGVPYALLIPGYPPSQPILDAMRSDDWSLLQGLLARIERYMQAMAAPSAPRWSRLARRLREQLLEMPPRFRYGSLNITSVSQADSPTLSFRFDRVMCGARELPRLTLHWRPHGPLAGIDLLCDAEADASPPLPLWTNDAHGASPGRVTLLLVPAERDPNHRDDWPRLTQSDRVFVMTLLARWPDIVAEVPPPLQPDAGLASLIDAAGQQREAQQRRELESVRGEQTAVGRAMSAVDAEVSMLSARIARLEAELDVKQSQIVQLDQQLTDAQQTAKSSIALQTLREADLEDLQGRYQTVIAKQESQHELLSELAQRLTEANVHFHQLTNLKEGAVLGQRSDDALGASLSTVGLPSEVPVMQRATPVP